MMSDAEHDVKWPTPSEGEFIIPDYVFEDGSKLPELRLHYWTLGKLRKNADGRASNAVMIMHGTTGAGANFFQPIFAGELFNPGQLLDANEYFIVLPDGIGHGGSSKPSDGSRANFPRYCYTDMVHAQHALLTQHLEVDHLRLVMGTSEHI
jgi:homoserine O-acetyltransferase/O-succinyltransferase